MAKTKILCLLLVATCLFAAAPAIAERTEVDPEARLAEFNAEVARLEEEMGILSRYWPIETLYELYQKYSDVVYPPEHYGPIASLPREDEISQEDARALIVGALEKKKGKGAFESEREWVEIVFFQQQITGLRTWTFIFAHPVPGSPDNPDYVYEVALDAKTGKILYISDSTTGWG